MSGLESAIFQVTTEVRMPELGRPEKPLILTEEQLETLERWARRPKSLWVPKNPIQAADREIRRCQPADQGGPRHTIYGARDMGQLNPEQYRRGTRLDCAIARRTCSDLVGTDAALVITQGCGAQILE